MIPIMKLTYKKQNHRTKLPRLLKFYIALIHIDLENGLIYFNNSSNHGCKDILRNLYHRTKKILLVNFIETLRKLYLHLSWLDLDRKNCICKTKINNIGLITKKPINFCISLLHKTKILLFVIY